MVAMGTLAMATAIALLPAIHSLEALLAALALLAVGSGVNTPALNSLTSRGAEATEQGATLGAAQGFSSLARAIGPSLGGWLFDGHLAYPFAGAALLLFAAFVASLPHAAPRSPQSPGSTAPCKGETRATRKA